MDDERGVGPRSSRGSHERDGTDRAPRHDRRGAVRATRRRDAPRARRGGAAHDDTGGVRAWQGAAKILARLLDHVEEEDLGVEVVSPSDRASDVASKAAMWVDSGVRLVWVVDPQARLATVHHPGGGDRVVREDGVLDGEDVLPGFQLPLRSIFP